jgi:hypothetical protein
MSFIHKFIEDTVTPEPVKYLFSCFVYAFEKQDSINWNKHVKQTTNEYHRKTILKQGRCDFDKPPLNLTSEELIVLYNYYYFPMHFQSSFEIYKKLFEEQVEFQNQTFFFHDFGCGTLSCTLAFTLAMQIENSQHTEYTTCGIFDLCDDLQFYYQDGEYEPICKKGFYTFGHPILQYTKPKFPNGLLLSDISATIKKYNIEFLTSEHLSHFLKTADVYYSEVHLPHNRVVSEKIYLGPFSCANSDEYPLIYYAKSINKPVSEITAILNFSYVLASESIDIDSIKSLINQYQKTGCKLIIVNQNPDLDSLNSKWEELKKSINFDEEIEETKGVQPIKHFGSKSKSRYEVLFVIQDDIYDGYNLLCKHINLNDIDTEGDYLELIATIKKLDIFNANKIQKLNNTDNELLLRIPSLNQQTLTNLQNYLYYNEYFDEELNDVILNILNRSYFVEFLILLITENRNEHSEFLFPYFSDTEQINPFLYCQKAIIQLPNIMIVIWESIINNRELFQLCIYRLDHFIEQKNTFGIKFRKLLLESNNIIFLTNIQMAKIYEFSNCLENARIYIEKDVVLGYNSFYYSVFMQKYYPDYEFQLFINKYPQHQIGVNDTLPF